MWWKVKLATVWIQACDLYMCVCMRASMAESFWLKVHNCRLQNKVVSFLIKKKPFSWIFTRIPPLDTCITRYWVSYNHNGVSLQRKGKNSMGKNYIFVYYRIWMKRKFLLSHTWETRLRVSHFVSMKLKRSAINYIYTNKRRMHTHILSGFWGYLGKYSRYGT